MPPQTPIELLYFVLTNFWPFCGFVVIVSLAGHLLANTFVLSVRAITKCIAAFRAPPTQ